MYLSRSLAHNGTQVSRDLSGYGLIDRTHGWIIVLPVGCFRSVTSGYDTSGGAGGSCQRGEPNVVHKLSVTASIDHSDVIVATVTSSWIV